MKELNYTSVSEYFYRFADNVQRQLYISPQYPVLSENSYLDSEQNINIMYQLDSEIHPEHSLNTGTLDNSYDTAFNQMFMVDPCQTLMLSPYVNVTESDCELFAQGSVQQGLIMAITRYFEDIRYILTLYLKFSTDPTSNFTYISAGEAS